jgi:ABC-type multidrug transport system ATPase subunit
MTFAARSSPGDQWPEIPVSAEPVIVGRGPFCSVQISHASVSRRHLSVRRGQGPLEIEDLDSRFGTFVNGTRIRKCFLAEGDTLRFGSSPPYRYDGDRLRAILDGEGLALAIKGLAIRRGSRTLLSDINLSIQPNAFLGIVGPSGSGKSLLLACLGSTLEPSQGTIDFDAGLPLKDHLDYYRSQIGIVEQDDAIYRELTAEENLISAVRIRIPSLPRAARLARVEAALDAVGLQPHRDKLVSVLSGGQRKRVSVAIELLVRPRLLLLDEPTSGLDPATQAQLMEILRHLARQGVTVICSTHTLDTIHYFDEVIALGSRQGCATIAFVGEPRKLLPAFAVDNQADLFDRLGNLDAVSGKVADPGAAELKPLPPHGQSNKAVAPMRSPRGADIVAQAAAVWSRSITALRRDRLTLTLTLVQPCILACLALLSQCHQSRGVFSLFFLVLSSLWLGLTLTARELVRERALYRRDRLAGLHADAYLAGKTLCALVVVAAQAILIWLTARALAGSILVGQESIADNYQSTSIWAAWAVLLIVGFGGALLGFTVSAVARTERAAVTLLPLILIPQMLFSRVAYGDGGQAWSDPSPFNPIAMIHTSDLDSGGAIADFLISLPMISRPSATTLALLNDQPPPKNEKQMGVVMVVVGEWAYLALILALYAVAFYLTFRVVEKRQLHQRR